MRIRLFLALAGSTAAASCGGRGGGTPTQRAATATIRGMAASQ